MNTPALTRNSLLQYGLLALPVAFAGFPLYVLAPDFYATHHGVTLSQLGVILLLIRFVDAVQDPLIGWLLDGFRSMALPCLVTAGFLLCLAVLALFNFVAFSPAVWFALCMLVAVSAYSVLVILLGAQATLWTKDEHEQTRIAIAREAFGITGLVTAVSLPMLLAYLMPAERIYLWYSAILAVLMLAGVTCFARLSTRFAQADAPHPAHNPSLPSALRALPGESWQLLGVYALSMLASSIPVVLVIFFVRDLLGAEHLTGVFLLLYFLSGATAMPIWKRVSVRVGKYRALAFANLLAVVGFVGAFCLDAGDVWLYALICVVTGLAFGADLTLPPSLLSDQIHSHNNTAFSATHYALLAFLTKASLALASALALPVLDLSGFRPQLDNSGFALATLSATYALVPCALKLMAAGLLYYFFVRSPSGGNNEHPENHRNYRSSHHA